MMQNVVGLHGVRAPVKEVNAVCIDALERMLEAARAGDVVGVAIIPLHHDNTSSFCLAGSVGGYSMLGALAIVEHRLITINEEG